MRQIAATCRRDMLLLPRVTCENHCRCDRILSLRFVARIQTGLNSCNVSQRQNKRKQPCRTVCSHLRQNLNQPMRKHQLVSRHVKFELVYISSLPKSITCTEQVSYRSDLSQDQCRRGDLSPRCVAAICRIVCLGLNGLLVVREMHEANIIQNSRASLWRRPCKGDHLSPCLLYTVILPFQDSKTKVTKKDTRR